MCTNPSISPPLHLSPHQHYPLTIPLTIPLLQEPYCSHPLPDGRSMRLTLTIYPAQDHWTGTSSTALTVLAVKCQPCGLSCVSRDCTAMCRGCTLSSNPLDCKHFYSTLSPSFILSAASNYYAQYLPVRSSIILEPRFMVQGVFKRHPRDPTGRNPPRFALAGKYDSLPKISEIDSTMSRAAFLLAKVSESILLVFCYCYC